MKGTELLATGAGDNRALIVDARGLEVLADLGSAGDSIISVKFYQGTTSDNSSTLLLATASMDGVVRVYTSHPEMGIALKWSFEGPGVGIECNWIDWHFKGPVLIAGYGDGSVWMWNVLATIPEPMAIFAGHVTTPVTCGSFTPDGKLIVAGSGEGVLMVYNPKDIYTPVAKIVPQHHQSTALGDITQLAVHPGNQIFMAGDSSGHLRVYKCSSASSASSINQSLPLVDLSSLHTASIESLEFHPQGNLAVSGSLDGQAIIYDSDFSPRHKLTIETLFGVGEGDEAKNSSNKISCDSITMAKWLAGMPNASSLDSSLSFGLLLGTCHGRLGIIEGRSGNLLRRFKGRPGRPILDASVSAGGILGVAFDDGIISLFQL